ncbi:MAG TPA: hypothetical protein VEU95_13225 [Micropepsaceae bacterium]|nr:hypothetical protein [Micropepsaceae bacterium]
MTRKTFTTTTRLIATSALGALALAVALPQAGFAATPNGGIWKVNPATMKMASGSVTLTIERVDAANPAAAKFIVISNRNVYLVAAAPAGAERVLIGTNARSTDYCGSQCQWGPLGRLTMTFKPVDTAGSQINDMLASNAQKQ